MPSLLDEDKLIAILFSDLHLTMKQPACRADDDWMEVQERYLGQLKTHARTGLPSEVPIIFAGDLFDRWNPTPELINFALRHLPDGMLCVPGQHDLPNHRIDEMHRSGYGVLKTAGKIIDLSAMEYYILPKGRFVLWGFGWNQEIHPPNRSVAPNLPHVAVVHKYVHLNRHTSYPGAPVENKLSGELKRILQAYDSVVIGDNHIHWMA